MAGSLSIPRHGSDPHTVTRPGPRAESRSKVSGDAYFTLFFVLLRRFRLFFSTRAAASVLDVFVDDAAFGAIFLSAT
jgi:hypothetical protein